MPTYHISLDLKKTDREPSRIVAVRLGDVGTQVVSATVTDGGDAWAPPEKATATVEIIKPDGAMVRAPAAMDGGRLVATLPDAAVSCVGRCRIAYFAIRVPGVGVMSTEGFQLRVIDGTDDHAESSAGPYISEYDRLLELYRGRLDAAASGAESAATFATQSGGAANEAAAQALAAASSITDGMVEYSMLTPACREAIAASAAAGVELATPEEVDAAFEEELAPVIASRYRPGLTEAELDEAVKEIFA